MNKIGDFISEKRRKQYISVKGLSKLTGDSHSEIAKIESGESGEPSPHRLKAIANILGIDQIECFKTVDYLDETQSENSTHKILIPHNLTDDEYIKIQNFISFLQPQRAIKHEEMADAKEKKLKVASLFAGIGGICYGFKQAGAQIVWANEIDKDACKTYRHNFGDKYLVEGDIKLIDPNDIPDIDILNGGFPCQAFSVAGYRKGFQDERGNLFFEIERILKIKKPRALLLENVKNLERHDHGNTYKVIKQHLENLGYHVHQKILNTMDYGDIPQHRERIYIVGFISKEVYQRFKYPDPIPLTKNIHSIIDVTQKKPLGLYYNNSKYYSELKKIMVNPNTVYQWRRIYCRENKSNVCPTLTANMGTGGHNVPLIIDNYGFRKLTPEECVGFQGFPKEFEFPGDISNTSKYKQAGNSVSVPVIKRIANEIIRALNN